MTLLYARLNLVCWRRSASGSLSEIVAVTKGKPMEVNGIAHIFLTASNFERPGANIGPVGVIPWMWLKIYPIWFIFTSTIIPKDRQNRDP
jgi:hypothetical protein